MQYAFCFGFFILLLTDRQTDKEINITEHINPPQWEQDKIIHASPGAASPVKQSLF